MALFDITAPYFPVFFVPAAVGVIVSLEVLAQAWVQFVAAIFLSSAATLVTTGWVMQSVLRLTRREREI